MPVFLPRRYVHNGRMTDLLEKAVAAARELPSEMQDAMARLMLTFAGKEQPGFHLTAEEEASFAKSLAQADRREFATDEQVRAVWAKHGL
jgi:hypothetical protein